MLKTCFAASILAVLALAVPLRAQPIDAWQQARDTKVCTEQGAGPDADGYSQCMAQRKIDRFQQDQKRAASMAAMPKGYRVGGPGSGLDPQTGEPTVKTGPLSNEMMYLMPEGTRALQGVAPPHAELSVTTTKVCATEGDAANPQAKADAASSPPKGDAADPQANCQTNVEVTKKIVQATRPDPRDDPTSATAHTYMHPGDIFNDHTQLGGP